MRLVTPVLLALLVGCSVADRREADQAGASMAQDVGADQTSNLTEVTRPDVEDVIRLPSNTDLAGKWLGPEGLRADLMPLDDGRMRVAMRYTLDDEGTFEATRAGDTLVLNRPDGRVVLSYGAGTQTGMKWAKPGARCLIATVGSEAYCRPAN